MCVPSVVQVMEVKSSPYKLGLFLFFVERFMFVCYLIDSDITIQLSNAHAVLRVDLHQDHKV